MPDTRTIGQRFRAGEVTDEQVNAAGSWRRFRGPARSPQQGAPTPDNPTIEERLRAGEITDEQVNAAVSAYLADPAPGVRRIAKGVSLDVAAAVAEHEFAKDVLNGPGLSSRVRRIVVRTAILLTRPG
ncbi:hypothetical protein [Methylobacterium sp. WSM2598]|uniref:hypothetical protein n=1 Tax=Methylobacterium sp. WSM2598 TaxID=398261 RepID=UPI00037FFFFD|nr:hypothetical protein [Methylobacterium sp. WSM2598]